MKKRVKNQKLHEKENVRSTSQGPYWDWALLHSFKDEEGEIIEHVQANPDGLSETDAMFYKSDKEREAEILASIHKQKLKEQLHRGLKKLNSFQMAVIDLSSKFHDIRTIAEKLGVSKSLVHRELDNIRRIVGQS